MALAKVQSSIGFMSTEEQAQTCKSCRAPGENTRSQSPVPLLGLQPGGAEGQSAHSALQALTSALWQHWPITGTGTSHLFNEQPRVAGPPQQRWLLQSMFKYGLQGWTESPSHQVCHPLCDRVISSDGILRNRKSQLSGGRAWKWSTHLHLCTDQFHSQVPARTPSPSLPVMLLHKGPGSVLLWRMDLLGPLCLGGAQESTQVIPALSWQHSAHVMLTELNYGEGLALRVSGTLQAAKSQDKHNLIGISRSGATPL